MLASAGEIAVRQGNGFYLGADAGYIIPAQSSGGWRLRMAFDEIVRKQSSDGLLHNEDQILHLLHGARGASSSRAANCRGEPVCENRAAAADVDESENWTELVRRQRTKNTALSGGSGILHHL